MTQRPPDRNGLGPRRIDVPQHDSQSKPLTVLDALVQALPHLELNDIVTACQRGDVVSDSGVPLAADDPAMSRHLWVYSDPPDDHCAVEAIPIVMQTPRLVVVDKPCGLATTPQGSYVARSVVVQLRRMGWAEAQPIHRLDRLTSGIVVCTRDQRWRRPYQTMVDRGEMTKSYRAIVQTSPGSILPSEYSSRIEPQSARGGVMHEVDGPANSLTRIEELASIREGHLRLVRLTPVTGRTHQLRLHLAALGAPIIGDPLYGTASRDDSTELHLRSQEISFVDPIDGDTLIFSSTRRFPLESECDVN